MTALSSLRSRPAAVFGAMSAVLGVLWLNSILHFWDSVLHRWPGDVAYYTIIGVAAISCLARAREAAADQLAWRLLGAGLLLWCAGDLYFTVVLQHLDDIPAPSPADAFYLAFYPFAFVAITLLARTRTRGVPPQLWADALVAALTVAALCAAVVLKPVVDSADGSAAAVTVNVAYPVADLLLLALLAGSAIATRSDRDPAWIWLGAGLFVFGMTDSIYLFQVANDSYVVNGSVDFGWPAAVLIMCWAVGKRSVVPARRPHLTGGGIWPSVISAAVSVVLLLMDHFEHASTVAAILAATSLLAVLARLLQLYRSAQRSLRSEARAVRQLQQRAREQRVVAALGRAGLGQLDDDELMHTACEQAAEVLGATSGAVMLLQPDGTLRITAGHQLPDNQQVGASTVVSDQSQAGYTMLTGESVVCNDLTSERRFGVTSSLIDEGFTSALSVEIEGSRRAHGVLGILGREGRAFSAEAVAFLESVAHVIAMAIERTEAEEELRHNALHDSLTGLPNRTLCSDRLTAALARSRRTNDQVGLLVVDLDQFKLVNDSLGHHIGDEILRTLAMRISDTMRAADTVARLAGDQFAVVCEDLPDGDMAMTLGNRLARVFEEPCRLDDLELEVTACIGVAVSRPGSDAESLLREADAAMFVAKGHGGGCVERFDETIDRPAVDQLRAMGELRQALARGEFFVVYQPVVDITDGSPIAVEALLRWRHPERGVVPPADFIPVAERSGLIVPIGRHVLEVACAQAAAWQRAVPGRAGMQVAVNLSPRQLAWPTLVSDVREALSVSGLPPETLVLEITENAVVGDEDAASRTIDALRGLGVRVALDDFGSGYASVGYLKRLRPDALKIDRSFIAGIADGSEDHALAGAIVSMARSLGLAVVAEGIENERQLESIRELGCDFVQGFHVSRPLPAADLAAYLFSAPRRADLSTSALETL
jgi:diguanylate cyclase (GGDEF)-like protein